jgi:methylglutaconyl-CoA hydratase
MPPRLHPISLTLRGPLQRRLYSAAASEPLVRVTNLPAPNSGHIRILELNRPKARNAISKGLLANLRAEIDAVHGQYGPNGEELPPTQRFGGAAGADGKGPTRAVVLASAVDSSFCAGADLKERKGFSQQE